MNFTTNQLRVLAHLLHTHSVTTTATYFETSQPAVSRLLAEMRRKFGDPLLVRSGEGMSITDRGCLIRDEVEKVLEKLAWLAEPEEVFCPHNSAIRFCMGFSDSNIVTLVPPVVTAIKHAGSQLETRIRSIDPEFDVVHALANRELDLVVDCVTKYTRNTYENLRYAPLQVDEIVLLARLGHPVIENPPADAKQYCELKHVAPLPISKVEKGPIDGALQALNSPRTIQCFLPEYNLIPHALVNSNFVFTTSRRFAEYYAQLLPLEIVPAPTFFPKMEFRLLWHDVTQHNQEVLWLRKLVLNTAKTLYTDTLGK